MRRQHTTKLCRSRQAGFSIVEILVTLLIFSIVTGGLLVIFSNSSRLARSQTQLANIQQSQRVGHSEIVSYARMAGIGGLPATRLNVSEDQLNNRDYDGIGLFPNGIGIGVYNNVATGTSIAQVTDSAAADDADGDGTDEDTVLPGTDVLIVRGVFSTPVYYVPSQRADNGANCSVDISGWLAADKKSATGCITVGGRTRDGGAIYEDLHQDVTLLSDRLKAMYKRMPNDAKSGGFILRDLINPNAYAVMGFNHAAVTNENQLDPYRCPVPPEAPAGVTEDDMPLCLNVPLTVDLTNDIGKAYVGLTRGTSLVGGGGMTLVEDAAKPDLDVEFPTNISSLGVLEEFRFFVRVDYEAAGDPDSRLTPVLSRAQFLPNTNVQVDVVDIADNVIELQLAVGVDTDEVGSGPEYGLITEDGTDTDEVLFNASGDYLGADQDPPYAAPPGGALPNGHRTWFNPDLEFHYLRINTVVMADRRELDYQAPELTNIEDFNRGDSFSLSGKDYSYNDLDERRFRRRWLQTVVELRNLL